MEFYSFDEWYEAVTNKGYEVGSWGFGSKSAHDENGKVVGEWVAAFDTYTGIPEGWADGIVEE